MNETPLKSSEEGCYACRVFQSSTGRRIYYETDEYLIFENLSTMTPILVAKEHGDQNIPFHAFEHLKSICSKLYGDCYCLNPETTDNDHYLVKVVRLTSAVPTV